MSSRISEGWDLLIIGGGPAGLTAGIYATRSGLKCVLAEGGCTGGQAIKTDRIENYPGFPGAVAGIELMDGMRKQAEGFGLRIMEFNKVLSLETGKGFIARLAHGEEIQAESVILATGAEYRDLDVPGAERLKGRGISYCATCDGPFFRDKPILVVGGGNSALEEALYLTRFASRVFVAHRRDRFRADKVLQDRVFRDAKIAILLNTIVTEVLGSHVVERAILKNVNTGELSEIALSGIFVYIGTIPNTGLVQGIVNCDDKGYILTDAGMATSYAGMFAAGDCRQKKLRQIATAVGEGALAATMAYDYLQGMKGAKYP